VLVGLAEERRQLFEQEFRLSSATQRPQGCTAPRDVAGVQLRLVGVAWPRAPVPPTASTGMARGVPRLRIVFSTSRWKVLK
jgi:hypothetical protein